MNRVIKTFTVIILLFTIGACVRQKKTNETSQKQKPNIIYILADDLGYGGFQPQIVTNYLRMEYFLLNIIQAQLFVHLLVLR
jgi:hypothetical protein